MCLSITIYNCDSADILARKFDFYSQANYFLARFGHVPVMIKSKLFLNFGHSFYGCQFWDLQDTGLSAFDILWRKVVRRLWGLSPRTHSIYLPFLMLGQSFRAVIASRFCKFAESCLHSVNCYVRCIAQNACHTPLSRFGKNLFFVCNNIDVPVASPHASLICELVFCRNGYFESNVSVEEIAHMLRSVCCD